MVERLTGEGKIQEKNVGGTMEAVTDCVKKTSVVFDADRNFILNNYALSATDECLLSQVTGTYILDEETKVLIFQSSDDDELASFNITSITAHQLKLHPTESDYVTVLNKYYNGGDMKSFGLTLALLLFAGVVASGQRLKRLGKRAKG